MVFPVCMGEHEVWKCAMQLELAVIEGGGREIHCVMRTREGVEGSGYEFQPQQHSSTGVTHRQYGHLLRTDVSGMPNRRIGLRSSPVSRTALKGIPKLNTGSTICPASPAVVTVVLGVWVSSSPTFSSCCNPSPCPPRPPVCLNALSSGDSRNAGRGA